MDVELQDWEVLDDSNSVHTTAYLDAIERDSDSIIRSDHFSLDSHKSSHIRVEDVPDHVSVDSDHVSDSNHSITEPIGEISSAEGFDDGRYGDNEASNNELGSEIDELSSDSGEIECKSIVSEKIGEELVEKSVEAREQGSNEDVLVENVKSDGEGRNRVGVWWKLPFDLLKYCLFKASPVWTLSAAAAMLGVVILSRRLYKMRQKTRTLQIKVTVDDKKVSQVMSRAARLNEAFSVVKRTPMIRPSLPATGITPWPMMALR